MDMQVLSQDTDMNHQVTLLGSPAILVERELKNASTPQESQWLEEHLDMWRNELINIKQVTESHFASSKARIAFKYAELQLASTGEDVDHYNKVLAEYNELVMVEEKWRPKSIKFLTTIENRLTTIRRLRYESQSNF